MTYHFYWKESKCCRPKRLNSEKEEVTPQDNMTKLFKIVVTWLETTYANKIIMHKKIRWLLLSIFVVFSLTCVVFAWQLGPDEDQVRFLYSRSHLVN